MDMPAPLPDRQKSDMEYMEIVSPADFKTVDMPPATDKVPPVTPWR